MPMQPSFAILPMNTSYDRPMLIGIDGAQASGKTTCWNALKPVLSSSKVAFVPEMARIVAPQFGVEAVEHWDSLLTDEPRLREFFEAELALLRQLELGAQHAIIDSSALLITAYARIFLRERFAPPEWARYDWIFYCEPWPTPDVDGFRFIRGRSEVDHAYREVVDQHHNSARLQVLPADESRYDILLAHHIWESLR